MEYHVMTEDWQTEDEIYTHYTLAEASKQAQYLADRYGVNVDMYCLERISETEKQIKSHITVKPSIDTKPTGNYYWDHKGKYQFAAEME